ncbi:MAG: hypothetical protein IJG33_12975 [Selenomonadaceae bacterium]|nr:hypothetical protein [Selenomonadaceae bacterium]
MAHDSNVKELQDKIFKLASDNLHLEENEPPVIEKIVEVPPPDYQTLKKKTKLDSQLIHQLQHRCHTLEHMLANCDISPMSNIIKEYKSMSDFYLLQLIKEVEIYRVSSNERSELLDFVNYLHSVTSEIEDMLIIEH